MVILTQVISSTGPGGSGTVEFLRIPPLVRKLLCFEVELGFAQPFAHWKFVAGNLFSSIFFYFHLFTPIYTSFQLFSSISIYFHLFSSISIYFQLYSTKPKPVGLVQLYQTTWHKNPVREA